MDSSPKAADTTTRAYHGTHGQIHFDEPKGEGDVVKVESQRNGVKVTEWFTLHCAGSGSWVLI